MCPRLNGRRGAPQPAGPGPGPPPDRRVHVVVWHRPAKILEEMIAEGLEEEGELLARMWATVRLRTAQCTRVPSTRSMETRRAVHGGGRRCDRLATGPFNKGRGHACEAMRSTSARV